MCNGRRAGFRPEMGVFRAGGWRFRGVPARLPGFWGRKLPFCQSSGPKTGLCGPEVEKLSSRAWASATARDPTDTYMPSPIVRAGDEVILPPDYVQVWPEALHRAWGFSRFLVARRVETPKAGENPSRQAGRRGSMGRHVRRTPDHTRTALQKTLAAMYLWLNKIRVSRCKKSCTGKQGTSRISTSWPPEGHKGLLLKHD